MSPTRHQPDSTTKLNTTTTVVSVAVASRVATVVLMIVANAVLPTHDAGGVHKFRPRTFPVPAGSGSGSGGGGSGGGGVFSAFTRWDSAWFLSIADSGYPYPSSSNEAGGGDNGEAVDCRGTARAWGGEEYEHAWGRRHRHSKEEEGTEREEKGMEGESRGGDGEEKKFWSAGGSQPPRCRPDVPLEEQAHAFFPLYPWLVRWAAAALRALLLPTGLVLGEANTLVLAAVLVSNTCFVAAALLLRRLGAVVTGDSLLAHRGALAFCVTPASVFFSTAYTESLYAALSFAGLLVLFSEGGRRRRITRRTIATCIGDQVVAEEHNDGAAGDRESSHPSWWSGAVSAWVAAALLSLATLTRSNGIAGAGVLALEKLRWMAGDAGLFTDDSDDVDKDSVGVGAAIPPASRSLSAAANTQRNTTRMRGEASDNVGDGSRAAAVDDDTAAGYSGSSPRREGGVVPWVRLAACLVATALQTLLITAPYVLVQAYAYRKFCCGRAGSVEEEGGAGSGGTRAAELPGLIAEQLHPWCAWRVPSVYAHVQSAYWNVGALRYYHWKQIPNFLLATPALLLTVYGTAAFFSAQLRPLAATAGARSTKEVDEVLRFRRQDTGDGAGGGGGVAQSRRRAEAAIRHYCWAWLPEKLAGVFLGAPRLPHPASPPFERTGAAALIAQWAFLAFFATVCMNVQVATRFLAAACPPLHWWTASLLVRGSGGGEAGKESAGGAKAALLSCLRWYLGVYFVMGAVLHSAFLPWT